MDPFTKIILIEGIKESIKELIKRIFNGLNSKTDRNATIAAITSIQKATIRTRNYISTNGFKVNEDLTELWHDALNKVVAAKIDENLPKYLYQKAKFWGQPQDWFDNPGTLELVPKLNDLDETCDMLLQKL